MAFRTRLPFRRTASTATPQGTDVVFYVNADGDLVKKLADGTESVVGAAGDVSAAITAHEEDADAHSQYLTADS